MLDYIRSPSPELKLDGFDVVITLTLSFAEGIRTNKRLQPSHLLLPQPRKFRLAFRGVLPSTDHSQRYVEGLYDVHGSPMYVNRGIGTTQLPVRIGSRPELTVFEFHAA